MKNTLRILLSGVSVAKLNLVLVVVILSALLYILFAPITPAVYGKPTIVAPDSLYAGHTITYKIHTCRKVGDGVITTVTRQLVSQDDKELQPISLNTDVITNKSGCTSVQKTLLIPYSLPQGKYRLVIRGVYSIIPLRKPIAVTATSDPVLIHATSVDQEIQDLIDANTILQQQLQSRQQASPNSSTTKTSTTTTTNNSSTTTTNNPAVAPTKTNTSPTTPAPTTSGSGDGGTQNDGLIQSVINAIGGGIKLGL